MHIVLGNSIKQRTIEAVAIQNLHNPSRHRQINSFMSFTNFRITILNEIDRFTVETHAAYEP